MPKPLRFHPNVATDVSDAIQWYEGRSTGLGERFRLAVETRFDDIATSPEWFPRAFGGLDFQFARIPKFPYLVLFQSHGELVSVVGVFHSASDPAKWRRRAAE